MHELVITCTVCGAVRSISDLTQQPNLSNDEILAKAGHSPDCTLTNPQVALIPNSNEPNIAFYNIAGGN